MSVTGKRGVGIPIILLHDAEGGTITVELKNGCLYKGILEEAQDNMNCTIRNCRKIDPNGIESLIEIVYIRGSQVTFVVLPDALQKAPFFNRINMWRKFSGHAVYGANTAMIESLGGRGGGRGRGGGGGRGVFPGRIGNNPAGRGGVGMQSRQGPGGPDNNMNGRGGNMMMPPQYNNNVPNNHPYGNNMPYPGNNNQYGPPSNYR